MPESLIWTGIFILSLAVLMIASERFIHSAEKVGSAFGISPFILGVTIVAAGTSLPELVSSFFAVFDGHSEIVIGNVVGSNITNIFLILGIVAVISGKIIIDHEILNVDLPLLIASAALLSLFVWDGYYSLFEAVLSIAGLIIYLVYTFNVETLGQKSNLEKDDKKQTEKKLPFIVWITILTSGVLIYFSADFTIQSIVELSGLFGVGKEFIALTAVALGTSLPELMVSIVAVRKGNPQLAVGNILGSNIFNSFAVMGIPAIVAAYFPGKELIIPEDIIQFSIPVMILASLLYFFIAQNKQIFKWEGLMLLIFYIYFIWQLSMDELTL